MGLTLVEKILARASGHEIVKAGESVEVEPDLVAMYDWEGVSDYIIEIVENELGKSIDAKKVVFFIDHHIPATNPREQAFHVKTLNWANQHGVRIYVGMGIGHELLGELGLVNPGDVVVHFDRHVNILGGLGIFSVGSRLELIMSLATGKFSIQVPETIQVNLQGHFQPGVMGRDLLHRMVADMGPDGALGQVLEFGGPGAEKISIQSRLSICCLAMFTGATTAIFEPDRSISEYFSDQFHRKVTLPTSDSDCSYVRIVHYDVSILEPQIVIPSEPQNTVPLKDVAGTAVQQGYIGSCAGGRLEDLAVAARILQKARVAEGFRLYVVPSSNKIMAEAAKMGYLEKLLEAGAWVSSPTCDFCFGKTQNLADGEAAISTGTLNVPGRMGSLNAQIYLGSAASVAAAALKGAIADPRNYL